MNAQEILEKHKIPSCHTDFQIENFIIGKESSPYGQMWQCIRELQNRQETLDSLELDLAECDDNIELVGLKLSKYQMTSTFRPNKILENFDEQKRAILCRKTGRKLLRLQKAKESLLLKKKEITDEMDVFAKVFNNIISKVAYKDYNDQEAQLYYWTAKLDAELNLNALLNNPVSTELIKTCLALPDSSPVKKQITIALGNANKKLTEKPN